MLTTSGNSANTGDIKFDDINARKAQVYMKLGQYNSALNDLNNVNSISKSPNTYKNMAKCREKLGNITEALSSYQEALKLCGADKIEAGKILLERGRLYMLQGKPDLAFQDFDDALTIHETLDKLPLAEVKVASI